MKTLSFIVFIVLFFQTNTLYAQNLQKCKASFEAIKKLELFIQNANLKFYIQKEDIVSTKGFVESLTNKLHANGPNEFLEKKYIRKRILNAKDENGASLLHVAISNKSLEIIRYFIENGANVNEKDKNNATPLHIAASNESLKIVEYLIENGAKVRVRDKVDTTPLHIVLDLEIIKLLVQKGADVNAETFAGDTPLHSAINYSFQETKHYAKIKFLIATGADVDAKNKGGETPLMLAVRAGDLEAVRLLLDYNASTDIKNNLNQFPFTIALAHNQRGIAKFLIERNIDLDEESRAYLIKNPKIATFLKKEDLAYRLKSSINNRDFYLVKSLVEEGVNLNTKYKDGNTPLHIASLIGNSKIVEYLIENNARVNAKNKWNTTPLFLAYNPKVVALLIKKRAKMNAKTFAGNTPLHSAIKYPKKIFRYKKIELLVTNGSDISIRNKAGETPLMLAVQEDDLETVKLLLDNGADTTIQDNLGLSPLAIAIENRNLPIAKLLVEKGANVNARDALGRTVFQSIPPSEHEFIKLLAQNGALLKKTDWNKHSHSQHLIYLYHLAKNPKIATFLAKELHINLEQLKILMKRFEESSERLSPYLLKGPSSIPFKGPNPQNKN